MDLVNDNKSIASNSTKLNKAWRRLDKTKINHVKLLKPDDNSNLNSQKEVNSSKTIQSKSHVVSIFTYSVSNNLVRKCSQSLNLDIELKTSDEKLNDLFGLMTIKNDYKDRFTSKQILKSEYCSDINWEDVFENKNIPDILRNDLIFYSPVVTNYIRGLSTDIEAEFSI